MKIQIEFKGGKYTITYGKLKAAGPTVKDTVALLVETYKKDIEVSVATFQKDIEKLFIH